MGSQACTTGRYFSLLNELNKSMQGQLKDVFPKQDTVDALKKKKKNTVANSVG